ncbi:MAG: adenosylhomocysteine nucleosidase [Paraglaciecola sp.]|jgi:adenosylhomocysteine nucleosidase
MNKRKTRSPHFIIFILLFTFVTHAAADSQFGPREFVVSNKWTAIVAAYEPEIKAIDAAFANEPQAQIS